MAEPHIIGIISDTHGVLPVEVFDLFAGVNQIIHAGDIGSDDILIELGTIAPVVAVFGNMDHGDVRRKLKERLDFHLCGFDFVVTHIPMGTTYFEKPTIRISGHTHSASVVEKNGSYIINPGTASQPRRSAVRSVAKLMLLGNAKADAHILYF